MNLYFILAALFTVLAVLSTYIAGKRESRQSEEELQLELQEKNREIRMLNERNLELADELAARGSYPQANVVSKLENRVATVVVTLNGGYAVENLILHKNVTSEYSEKTGDEIEDLSKSRNFTDLGTLKTHQPAAFDIPMTEDEVAVQLQFSTKKKQWNQHIRIKKTPQGQIKSFWILTNGDSEVIDKHIDEGFPVDEDGKLRLWKNSEVRYSDIEVNSIFRN